MPNSNNMMNNSNNNILFNNGSKENSEICFQENIENLKENYEK